MKNRAIQYVAIDVHQATLVVSVRDEQGSVVMRATVATEAKAIDGVVRGLGSRVHVAFEEGTQAQWLHDLLTQHVEQVVVCNIRGRREMTNKNDRRGRGIRTPGTSETLTVIGCPCEELSPDFLPRNHLHFARIDLSNAERLP